MAIMEFRTPVMEKLGGVTMISPLAFVSKNRSGCSAQKSANCWSVIGGAVSVAGRKASSIVNGIFVSYRIRESANQGFAAKPSRESTVLPLRSTR
jgi:hypothetical protein